MTDKVQKIREEIARLKEETSIGLSDHENGVEQGRMEIINALSFFIDTMQEEPVSEELEEAANVYISNENNYSHSRTDTFKAGAEWQKAKDESVTQDLGEYINELSKQFPEVSFAKLSRIAVRVSKWQKQQMMKDATEAT